MAARSSEQPALRVGRSPGPDGSGRGPRGAQARDRPGSGGSAHASARGSGHGGVGHDAWSPGARAGPGGAVNCWRLGMTARHAASRRCGRGMRRPRRRTGAAGAAPDGRRAQPPTPGVAQPRRAGTPAQAPASAQARALGPWLRAQAQSSSPGGHGLRKRLPEARPRRAQQPRRAGARPWQRAGKRSHPGAQAWHPARGHGSTRAGESPAAQAAWAQTRSQFAPGGYSTLTAAQPPQRVPGRSHDAGIFFFCYFRLRPKNWLE